MNRGRRVGGPGLHIVGPVPSPGDSWAGSWKATTAFAPGIGTMNRFVLVLVAVVLEDRPPNRGRRRRGGSWTEVSRLRLRLGLGPRELHEHFILLSVKIFVRREDFPERGSPEPQRLGRNTESCGSPRPSRGANVLRVGRPARLRLRLRRAALLSLRVCQIRDDF
jgi:hypothetical protein